MYHFLVTLLERSWKREKTMNKNENLKNFLNEMRDIGVISNYANIENFMKLEKEERTLYWGVDCTSDSIHIGHLLIIMQLFRFSENNFKIIFVLGGSTSTIGDPSDKLKERPELKKEVIKNNYKEILNQLSSISKRNVNELSLFTINENINENIPLGCFYKNDILKKIYKCIGIKIENNSNYKLLWDKFIKFCLPKKQNEKGFLFLNNEEWLHNLNFIEFVNEYGKIITVNYLLSKGRIKQRIESENGISFSEFSYSLLQGYDFYYLNKNYSCSGQVGASDQWGNCTTGLKIIKSKNSENKSFVISFNLMLDKNGKKISKTGNKSDMVWMDENKTSFNSLFDYFNNMEDNETINFAIKFTSLKREIINEITKINIPKSLRILQRILIENFFFIIHGNEGIKWLREKNIKMY